TRSKRDWSSDVCSSDLITLKGIFPMNKHKTLCAATALLLACGLLFAGCGQASSAASSEAAPAASSSAASSEENAAYSYTFTDDQIGRASCREQVRVAER